MKTIVLPAFRINPISNDPDDTQHLNNGLVLYVLVGHAFRDWAVYEGFVLAQNFEESFDTMTQMVKRFGNKVGQKEALQLLKENPQIYHIYKKLPYRE